MVDVTEAKQYAAAYEPGYVRDLLFDLIHEIEYLRELELRTYRFDEEP